MAKLDTRTARFAGQALACALGLGLGAAAVAAGTAGQSGPKEPVASKAAAAPEGDGGARARDTYKALGEIHAAVRKEASGGSGTPARPPERPKKTVVTPTMTPADLDALVDSFLEKAKVPPASPTTDVEFVRRIYLDVTGKLPTPDQTRAFVATREKDKRVKLIDQLLAGKDYATNWGRYWRDVIKYHATNEQVARYGYNALETWLTEQLATNQPWDKVAHDLITATGRTDENGATLFAFSHETQPVEVAGEVSRIFLGVQIQCAQCHDHPNDSWKREQFHEFAAFFAGSKARRANPKENPPVFEVVSQPRARYTMPDLKNPQTLIPVAPRFFLASQASPLPAGLSPAERHELAASFVTGQDNPWFAKAYVNRIWYALTGDAFFTPVDDMGPERTAKAPEVLDALASQWQQGGYDVRWLFRTILNSKTYQREVRSTFSASGRTPFAANCPSRLRADQVFDALMQVLNLPQNGQGGGGGMGKGAAKKNGLAADLKGAAPAKKGMRGAAGNPRNGFNALFGIDPSMPSDDVLGTIPQSLMLMNGPQLNRAMEARPGTVLGDILTATPDNRAALGALYLRVFAREPTAKEVQTCGRYLATVGDRQEGFEDILWSLINSTEFITRR